MAAPDLELIVVAVAERGGITRRALARAAESGRLVHLRRGVYAEAEDWYRLTPLEQHVVTARAVQATSDRQLVLSHWTAAVLHGLPVPQQQLAQVHVTVPQGGGRSLVGAVVHAVDLAEAECTVVDDLLCTGRVRTVLDVASASTFSDAVALTDAHLHATPPSARDQERLALHEAWAQLPPRRSRSRVPAVLDFADGLAESPGESVSRVTMHALRLPVPVLQHDFFDGSGLAGRTDFWFPDEQVIGEMDGRSKYLDPGLNHGDAAQVVYDEKRREDRLRALVRGFARWDWRVARSPTLLRSVLGAAGVRASAGVRTASGRV